MKQIPLPIGVDAEPDFDNFVAGDNAAAVDALRRLVIPSPPVYLWGPAGAGKTHLLAALARQLRAEGARVGWFDAETPLPWEFDEGWWLVVIDGAERLDAERQHAAFALFVESATHGAQMAAAGRLPPVDLPVRDDLRTRLGWGQVHAIKPLTEAGTRAALRREADRRGIFLSDDVMDYLLTRFARDLGSLMTLLGQLDRFSLAERRAVTVPLLKKMINEESGHA
ncbi:DnaA regulatory inactivator Hda [Ideonella sp. DXS29W]|uniref:DnaA regulatory inactivator Hda n=1 Tax=Ideonella lacteola TaxID=2984193 RepID=A0ABU9BN86_9BURK